MDFLVWGAGAIGGTVGAYLARAGHGVTLVDRDPTHVAAINGGGLAISGPIEEFTVAAAAYTPEAVQGRFGTVLLCVKAQDTAAALPGLAPHLKDDGCVVSLQNGLNEHVIAEVVGARRTVGAFVNFGADYLGPGQVLYGGRGAVVVGEIDGAITPRVTALHAVLQGFEPDAVLTRNIWGYLWAKLAYGAQLFATATTNESIADCLADAEYAGVYIALAQEVLAVAAAEGVEPEAFNGFDPRAFVPGTPPGVAERSLAEMVAFNRRSAKSHSGIWRDLAVRKRKTEVDALLGAVAARGAARRVGAPLTSRLIELVHEIEEGERVQERGNLAVLKGLL